MLLQVSSYAIDQIQNQVKLYFEEKKTGNIKECTGFMNTVCSLPCRHQIEISNANFSIPLSAVGKRWHLGISVDDKEDISNAPPEPSNFEQVDEAIAKTLASLTGFINSMPEASTRLQFAREIEKFIASKQHLQKPMEKPTKKSSTKGMRF